MSYVFDMRNKAAADASAALWGRGGPLPGTVGRFLQILQGNFGFTEAAFYVRMSRCVMMETSAVERRTESRRWCEAAGRGCAAIPERRVGKMSE